ncbi:hypothetical protein BABINDRAFT_41822 [Babjeviella inositovora NRRL Y-12698]|uniref:GPI ethanolamine phosphate transferase 1 n=1 Tax=Babjeviella inositovora NRRL Y-12698 TaxID=984486 RepID=A0A1E3QHV6_9ASCO|nr:uncharacterized protein BABINDRAFT_41822 [Babjeviella inositovora NRRL Y-12698]ODQ77285.1 hypothetical protein BABINDRAFT_41822 [Babjeviella inositovora NRRL Y-12698]
MNRTRLTLLVVGVLFHLCYLWSIFDIYFVSPLVHGMQHHNSIQSVPVTVSSAAPAKRLFLIVGDGLRADKTFDLLTHPSTGKTEYLAPYLRSLVLHNATYGVSHTRMPTESRPGHVAMIAGFYEDVSAVTKGWKENPVDFDSCFNQSRHTYSFGSPDILPMFAQGASDKLRIDTWMYGHEFEDFSKSSIELDAFVFRHLDELMANSTADEALDVEIRQEGNIFFLHLLGCDTAGHSYRPYSAEYYDNIKYIDQMLEKVVPRINAFFDDEDTAFIFTADHGMSDFGSHGDGHPDNTRTPIIAWGAGINKPVRNEQPVFSIPEDNEDTYMAGWGLEHVRRNDVKQADIASLMSYLVGINYPANSVGELPLAFVLAPEAQKLRSLYQNSLAVWEQYRIKEQEVSVAQFSFKPFPGFATKTVDEYKAQIEAGINSEDPATITVVEEFMQTSLEGLTYLQTYNWLLLRTIASAGFVGWIVYSFIIFLRLFDSKDSTDEGSTFGAVTDVGFAFLTLFLNYVLFVQRSPFNYHAYLAFPLFFWKEISVNKRVLVNGITAFFANVSVPIRIASVIGVLAIFESIVYGFFNRRIFSVVFVALGVAYPALLWKTSGSISLGASTLWFLTCCGLSTFTLFDAVKVENLALINIGGAGCLLVGVYGFYYIATHPVHHHKGHYTLNGVTSALVVVQILLVVVSLATTQLAVVSLQARAGLPKLAQYGGFAVLLASLVVLPVAQAVVQPRNKDYRLRLLTIFLLFAPTFIILTISFEAIFYLTYSLMLLQWIELESRVNACERHKPGANVWIQVLRVAVVGFFYLQIAFFGTGNVASISSFSLDSVYRLLPIFDPFPMGALLMLKLVIPYVLLSVALGIMNHKLHIETFTITTLVISTSDILSMNFFFLVKTEGSWLDIGVTISNYCLAILSSLFMLLLEFISQPLLHGVEILSVEEVAVEKVIEKVERQLDFEDKPEPIVVDLDDETPVSARLRRVRKTN